MTAPRPAQAPGSARFGVRALAPLGQSSRHELIQVAELGWPKRKLHSHPKPATPGGDSIEV